MSIKTTSLALAALLVSVPATAESLRCQAGAVAEGDSKLSLLYKCGEPLLQDSHCAPAYYSGTLNPVPAPYSASIVPCLVTEEWLYERGPGNLVATVELRGGKVRSIKYGYAAR